MPESLCQSIETYFSELPDPRSERNRRHKLADMMVIALCGMLSSADDFVAIEEYGQAKEDWFRQYLDLPNGIPSHDTFSRLFAALDREALQESFRHWARHLIDQTEQIAIDGKRQCGSHDKGEYPPCSVNAYSVEQGLVLMQKSTENKRSELAGIKAMLELLDVSGCLVSLDAGGSYQEVAEQIVARGGDYLLAIKSNQGKLYKELDAVFEDHRVHETSSEAESSHGRVDQRHTWACHEIGRLTQASTWPSCSTVGMVQRIYREGDAERAEHRYYISSRVLDAAELAERVRSHWAVENGLHWVLDVAFDEDRSRARVGQSAANLVVLRQWAFNLLKQENSRRLGIKNKRKKAGWDMNYLTTLLRLAETA